VVESSGVAETKTISVDGINEITDDIVTRTDSPLGLSVDGSTEGTDDEVGGRLVDVALSSIITSLDDATSVTSVLEVGTEVADEVVLRVVVVVLEEVYT